MFANKNSEYTLEATKEILKQKFNNYDKEKGNKTNFSGTILVLSGHGGKDFGQKGYFLLETTDGEKELYYSDIVKLWQTRANPEINKNLLVIIDACYSGAMV